MKTGIFLAVLPMVASYATAFNRNFTVANMSLHELIDTNQTRLGGAAFMDCGSAPLCGVVVLQSGYGQGKYSHPDPAVHGLWPETGNYGSSDCMDPQDPSDPTTTAECYNDLDFMVHEWEKHGVCAGVKDSPTFFSLICSLTSDALVLLTKQKQAGASLQDMATALKSAGYPVYYVDSSSDSQVYISACSSGDGNWHLSDPSDFSKTCQGSGLPSSDPGVHACYPGEHGPPCQIDAECSGGIYQGCKRCAVDGFCTCADSTGKCG